MIFISCTEWILLHHNSSRFQYCTVRRHPYASIHTSSVWHRTFLAVWSRSVERNFPVDRRRVGGGATSADIKGIKRSLLLFMSRGYPVVAGLPFLGLNTGMGWVRRVEQSSSFHCLGLTILVCVGWRFLPLNACSYFRCVVTIIALFVVFTPNVVQHFLRSLENFYTVFLSWPFDRMRANDSHKQWYLNWAVLFLMFGPLPTNDTNENLQTISALDIVFETE